MHYELSPYQLLYKVDQEFQHFLNQSTLVNVDVADTPPILLSLLVQEVSLLEAAFEEFKCSLDNLRWNNTKPNHAIFRHPLSWI